MKKEFIEKNSFEWGVNVYTSMTTADNNTKQIVLTNMLGISLWNGKITFNVKSIDMQTNKEVYTKFGILITDKNNNVIYSKNETLGGNFELPLVPYLHFRITPKNCYDEVYTFAVTLDTEKRVFKSLEM